MAESQITYVRKLPHLNPDDLGEEGITHIGGNVWNLTVSQAIESLGRGLDTFYVETDGRLSWVCVVEGRHGKYLRAQSKGIWNDDLVRLPDFPAHQQPGR